MLCEQFVYNVVFSSQTDYFSYQSFGEFSDLNINIYLKVTKHFCSKISYFKWIENGKQKVYSEKTKLFNELKVKFNISLY